jgi:D-alanine-D-alanine ligase
MKNILLLINELDENSALDETDVLVQADAVEEVLIKLGYSSKRLSFGLDLKEMTDILLKQPPDLIFNLVETVGGKGALIHLCPSLLESSGIPFTGSGTYAMVATTDKILTKKILEAHGILYPELLDPDSKHLPDPAKLYIKKPKWEDGSAGITDESVMEGKNINISKLKKDGAFKNAFLEEYIEGREFNLSVIDSENGPKVLPPAEMLYLDYPKDKPRILNYASKWDTDSFEYHKTIRTSEFRKEDNALFQKLAEISLQCWQIFAINGYMRIDFRVDQQNRPWVLEINANPCISPDAGFVAACLEGGFTYSDMIQKIISLAK